ISATVTVTAASPDPNAGKPIQGTAFVQAKEGEEPGAVDKMLAEPMGAGKDLTPDAYAALLSKSLTAEELDFLKNSPNLVDGVAEKDLPGALIARVLGAPGHEELAEGVTAKVKEAVAAKKPVTFADLTGIVKASIDGLVLKMNEAEIAKLPEAERAKAAEAIAKAEFIGKAVATGFVDGKLPEPADIKEAQKTPDASADTQKLQQDTSAAQQP
ncbi:MAG: hypothetical protein V4691_04535, partial [Pseudomonadota bacterium]